MCLQEARRALVEDALAGAGLVEAALLALARPGGAFLPPMAFLLPFLQYSS